MLDDLSILVETKDVHASPIVIARPLLKGVEHDVVAVSEHTLEQDVLARIFVRHPVEILDEPRLPVWHHGIMLDVRVSDILFNRLGCFDPLNMSS